MVQRSVGVIKLLELDWTGNKRVTISRTDVIRRQSSKWHSARVYALLKYLPQFWTWFVYYKSLATIRIVTRCPVRPVTFKSKRRRTGQTNTVFRRLVVVAARETTIPGLGATGIDVCVRARATWLIGPGSGTRSIIIKILDAQCVPLRSRRVSNRQSKIRPRVHAYTTYIFDLRYTRIYILYASRTNRLSACEPHGTWRNRVRRFSQHWVTIHDYPIWIPSAPDRTARPDSCFSQLDVRRFSWSRQVFPDPAGSRYRRGGGREAQGAGACST